MVLEIYDRIRVRRLTYFSNFEVDLKYDSLGSPFKFEFYFDPDNIEHKEMACIAHYHIAKLKEGNETILTGYVHSEVFNDFPEKKLVQIGGYSLPGVLMDCEIPFGDPSSWGIGEKDVFNDSYSTEITAIIFPDSPTPNVPSPFPPSVKVRPVQSKRPAERIWPISLEASGLSLREIATKILAPFGLQMVVDSAVDAAMDEPYDDITAKEKQSAKSFICELAAQKNIVVTDDQFGRVVFTRPRLKTPVFHFERGIPATSMSLAFNGRGMHSHIKVYQQADIDEEIPPSENLVTNPYVFTVFRPHVEVQKCGNADDTLNAANNVLARELKNLTLTITIDRWHLNGKLIRPGSIISVLNPNVYLYKKSNWLVEEVNLKGDATQTIATLKCVIPEVYTGGTPKYLFQGINLH